MALQIDWSALQRVPDVGEAVQRGFATGRAQKLEQVGQDALRTLATDPNNTGAYADLMSVAPSQALRFRADLREQADFNRGSRFRDALGGYLTRNNTPTRNALTGQERPTPGAAPTLNALGDLGGAPAPMPMDAPVPSALPQSGAPTGEDVVVTARPARRGARLPGGEGWDEVVRADPEKALSASKSMFSDQRHELEAWQTVSTAAMQMLGGVHDQDSYDRARAAAERLYGAYDVPFPDNLPDEYDPEAIHALQMQQLGIEDQVSAALREKRFEWQKQDDELDNTRADREAGDRATDRRERRSLMARGQNITSADRRRGQDVTDRRVREVGTGRGKAGRGSTAAPSVLPKITTRDAYNALPKGAEYLAPDGSHKVKK